MALDTIKKAETQSEAIRTGMNPLSAIPVRMANARETCIAAFEDARKAFGSQMGPAFEKAMTKVGNSDFQVAHDGESNIISTRMGNGGYLSLHTDDNTVTLTLIDPSGKEDSITYNGKEISRKRSV